MIKVVIAFLVFLKILLKIKWYYHQKLIKILMGFYTKCKTIVNKVNHFWKVSA